MNISCFGRKNPLARCALAENERDVLFVRVLFIMTRFHSRMSIVRVVSSAPSNAMMSRKKRIFAASIRASPRRC